MAIYPVGLRDNNLILDYMVGLLSGSGIEEERITKGPMPPIPTWDEAYKVFLISLVLPGGRGGMSGWRVVRSSLQRQRTDGWRAETSVFEGSLLEGTFRIRGCTCKTLLRI